jgi:P4 family phage/plasmid primase-like protien
MRPPSLLDESERYTQVGHLTIPISSEIVNGKKTKKPPKGSGSWTKRKGTVYGRAYLEKWFASDNKEVEFMAIAMDSIKLCISFDVDGIEGFNIFINNILNKLSLPLRNKINKTAHTKTPSGGFHWIFEISREEFPHEIKSRDLWTSPYASHSEIKLFGTTKYLIERGPGYDCIRGIDCLQSLGKDELNELSSVCERFSAESKAIAKISMTVLKCWKPPIRNGFVTYLSGYLKKDSDVPGYLVLELFEHVIKGSPFDDENLQKTLDTVNRTYSKNPDIDGIRGYAGLEEILANQPDALSILISTIKKELGKLGYHFTATITNVNYNNNNNDSDEVRDNDTNKEKNIIQEATESILAQYNFVTLEESGDILYYDGGRYVKGGEVLIKKLCEELYGFDLNIANRAEIREHIKNRTYHKLSEFDKNINMINLKNGLYDIASNKLLPHTPDYLSMNQIQVVYNPLAKPRIFGKFFSEILYPSEVRMLVELIAYTFQRDNPFEIIVILLGDGSNGKSVIFGILTALHGTENVSNVSLKSIMERPFALYDLVGKNCNLDVELSSGKIEDTAILKKITGRQLVRVEQKNQKAYDARIYAKVWLSANKIPYTNDKTDAWFRRNIIVTFPTKFDIQEDVEKGVLKLDPYLIDKLTTQEELSGIFNVLMNALRNILKNKEIFTNDKTIEERRIKYQSAVDPVQGFLDVAIDKESTETCCTTKAAAYMTFVEYCKVHRLPVLTKDAFGKSMTKHKVDEGFVTISGKRSRVWKGIRLTAEYDALAKKALTELNRNEKQKMNEGIEDFTDQPFDYI